MTVLIQYDCKEERLYIRSLLVSQISQSNNDKRSQIKTVLHNDVIVYPLFIYIFYASKRNHNFHSSNVEQHVLSLSLFLLFFFFFAFLLNLQTKYC